MREAVRKQLKEFAEKEEQLRQYTAGVPLRSYSISELHVLEAVDTLHEPTVTALAQQLQLTKGAVSKITKKLIEKELLTTYALAGNRQKLLFRYTPSGLNLCREIQWERDQRIARERAFLHQFSHKRLRKVEDFLRQYNAFLQQEIDRCEQEDSES